MRYGYVSHVGEREIIFVPDTNLGLYVQRFVKDKEMVLWPGYCPTHVNILKDELVKLKKQHPATEILVHPECSPEVIDYADHAFSTEGIISNNVVKGSRDDRAALSLKNCRWFTVTDCLLFDNDHCGLRLEDCDSVRITGCMVRDDRPDTDSIGVRIVGGKDIIVEDNTITNGVVGDPGSE